MLVLEYRPEFTHLAAIQEGHYQAPRHSEFSFILIRQVKIMECNSAVQMIGRQHPLYISDSKILTDGENGKQLTFPNRSFVN